jgi:hypothetical protein
MSHPCLPPDCEIHHQRHCSRLEPCGMEFSTPPTTQASSEWWSTPLVKYGLCKYFGTERSGLGRRKVAWDGEKWGGTGKSGVGREKWGGTEESGVGRRKVGWDGEKWGGTGKSGVGRGKVGWDGEKWGGTEKSGVGRRKWDGTEKSGLRGKGVHLFENGGIPRSLPPSILSIWTGSSLACNDFQPNYRSRGFTENALCEIIYAWLIACQLLAFSVPFECDDPPPP